MLKYVLYYRWDMSKPESHYCSDELKRTLEELFDLCTKKKNNFGCISPPLLHIKLENVRIDELHLLLRITGKYIYGYAHPVSEHMLIGTMSDVAQMPVLSRHPPPPPLLTS